MVRLWLQTALELAKRLEGHPRIERVHYPGLPSHSDYHIAKAQMFGGFGGVISFEASAKLPSSPAPLLSSISDLHGAWDDGTVGGRACLCAQVAADLWGTAKFVDSVRLPYIAPSLGGVDSLIEQPTVISYWDQVLQLSTSVACHRSGRPGRVVRCWTMHLLNRVALAMVTAYADSAGLLSPVPSKIHTIQLAPDVLLGVQGPEKRAEYGIKDNLIRFSCGLEGVEDIWRDLLQALEAIG